MAINQPLVNHKPELTIADARLLRECLSEYWDLTHDAVVDECMDEDSDEYKEQQEYLNAISRLIQKMTKGYAMQYHVKTEGDSWRIVHLSGCRSNITGRNIYRCHQLADRKKKEYSTEEQELINKYGLYPDRRVR